MIDWLKDNAEWICAIIMAICAVVTLIYHYNTHKEKNGNKQTISNVKNSNINQAGGDIKNVEKGRKKARDIKH